MKQIAGLILLGALAWSTALVAQPTIYTVNPEDSYIHVYTDTAGALGRFSHKHLVAITRIQGQVSITPEGHSAHLVVRPEDFLVDDDTERARAADPEFRESVRKDIQTGTRKNMLGARLLDVEQYPVIEVAVQLDRLSSSPLLNVSVHILGERRDLQVPAILQVDEQQLGVTGYFELSHADLGLQPYTAMGGLLRVADQLRVQFDISAEAAASTKHD
ncbi:MAG: YceI family protein [Porticoccaceae bacterium]